MGEVIPFKEEYEQMSMFSETNPSKPVSTGDKYKDLLSEPVSVMYSKTIDQGMNTPLEIFSGYDILRIVTFSYSLKYIEALLACLPFKNAEVIYGAEYMIGTDVYKAVADQNGAEDYKMILSEDYQKAPGRQASLMNILGDYPILQEKSRAGVIRMYLPNDGLLTHEKIYLLENSTTGATRIITGSANASIAAWNGSQGEFRDIRDNDEAYGFFVSQFEQYKKMSCSDVDKEARLVVDEDGNADMLELPVAKKAKNSKNGIIIRESANPSQGNIDYFVHMKKLAKTEQAFGAVHMKPEKDGTVRLTFKNLVAANKKRTAELQDKKQKRMISENPSLLINYENHTVSFEGKQRNLNPPMESIQHDLEALNFIFEGFNSFQGSLPVAPVYYKLFIYMAAAPFMAKLRNTASCSGVNKSMYLPGCCLVRGKSNSAKTKTAKAFQKMILGINPKPSSNKEFTDANIRGARQDLRGIPVIIDEVKGSRLKTNSSGTCMAENIAKLYTENDGVAERNPENEPFFIATSNAEGFINVQTQKRMPVFTIDGFCPREKALESDDIYEKTIKSIGTAAWDAYCGMMFEEMDALVEGIRNPSEGGKGIDDADIYAVTSRIILSLYEKCGMEPPKVFKKLNWRDIVYVDTSKVEHELAKINANHPDYIRLDRDRNTMILDLSSYNKSVADNDVELFANASPDAWLASSKVATEVIFSNLKAVEDTLGITFGVDNGKTGFLARISRMMSGKA